MKLTFEDCVEIRNKNNQYQEPDLKIWDKYLKMNMQEFSDTINKLTYKSDLLYGLIDKTGNINTFFDHKIYGRDCDDFARAWLTWGVANGYSCQEYIVTTPDKLARNAHVVDVIWKDGVYWLCNYVFKGLFTSEDKALNFMKRYPTYENGYIYAKGIFVTRTGTLAEK